MSSEQDAETYMGHKGKTSSSMIKYLSKYDVDQQIVSGALSFVQKLSYSYKVGNEEKRINPKTVNSIVVEVSPPSSGKGTVKLLDVNSEFKSDKPAPVLNKYMLSYLNRDFLGYKIYIHPEHVEHARKMEAGSAGTDSFIVQLLVIPGRGCITIPA